MRILVAIAVAVAVVAGCKNRTDVPGGDAYPQHERWWR